MLYGEIWLLGFGTIIARSNNQICFVLRGLAAFIRSVQSTERP